MPRHDFKAYDSRGRLVLHVWTTSQGAYAAERAAFQKRLNRCELFYVDVSSSDPHQPFERLIPRVSQP